MQPLRWLALALLVGGGSGVESVDAWVTATIDFAQTDLPLLGIGALSGGGGTSRLLYDYPEAQRADVLDALFLPGRGASAQILKVEIGGDAQSTEATEPSHAHTVEEHNDPNCTRCFNRGYEFWLLAEAKKRNPGIKTYGLSWRVPGWVGNGTHGQGGYYSQANIEYHVRWVQGLKRVHNVSLDYMGRWNEHNYKAGWIIELRRALDAAGPVGAHVQLVAKDGNWQEICADMASNKTLFDAIAVLGVHYSSTAPPNCHALGKPMITSEGWQLGWMNDWRGATSLARTLNANWRKGRQQGMIVWTLIYAWYSILPYATPVNGSVSGMGHGLMSAAEPWSGHFDVSPPLYAMAHHTQFTRNDGSCMIVANAAVADMGNISGARPWRTTAGPTACQW